MQPEPVPEPPKVPADLTRLVRRTLVAAAVPEALAHDGECGPKARCPGQSPDEPYRLLELRPDAILAFCRCHHGRHERTSPTHALLLPAFREALP